MAELVYPPVLQIAKFGFRAMGLRITAEGTEHIPRTGEVVLASTHVSYLDFSSRIPGVLPGPADGPFMAKNRSSTTRSPGR